MATKSDPNKKNNQEVKDDIGTEMLEKTKENIQKELEHYQNQLQSMQEGKDRFVKMWERDQRMYLLMLEGDNHRKIEPTHNYEKLDEYWDIRKSQLQDKYNEDKFVTEQKIQEYDQSIEHVQREIQSCKDKLAELDEGDDNE